jgi:starch synthase (maltosyl-transferring)
MSEDILRRPTVTPGRDDATPAAQIPILPDITLAEYAPPAILRIKTAEDIAQARSLGFNFILLPDNDLLADARSAGLGVLLELDLAHPDGATLQDHPDWFVHGGDGPQFRYLSENDTTVDWWDGKIAEYQQAGIAGFYARNAQGIAPAIWRHLLAAAKQRAAETRLIAEIFGASRAQIDALTATGFNFVTSSSCWWDFSAGWLNGDTARISRIAPALAHAAPPGTTGWSAAATLRALRFSAVFAPGWLVEASFITSPDFDLSEEIQFLNTMRLDHPALRAAITAQLRSSPGSPIALLARGNLIIAANAVLDHAASQPAAAAMPALGTAQLDAISAIGAPAPATSITPASTITLAPGEIRFFDAAMPTAILLAPPNPDCDAPRLAIEAITPQVDDGKFPVRRLVGDLVTIEADLLADGHDKLAGEVLFRAADETKFRAYPLTLINNDRWTAQIPLERLGRHVFAITAWKDSYASFVDEITKKHTAGIDTKLELLEGLALVAEAAQHDKKLHSVLEHLRQAPEEIIRDALLSEHMIAVMGHAAPRKFLVRSADIALDAERQGAAFASWYEIFPRSQSGNPYRHGTFTDVIRQLPRIAAMGFDVLYFPPIHPIGETNRKGRNNTLTPAPNDPGSPYATGSKFGGHDAIHPELGNFEDFQNLIGAAKNFGIEIALDFAIQCAPDHPWLQAHKDWFDWRPDGSLRYAENPPKKYEDIVNVDFYTDDAKPALWLALRDIVQFWVDQGIRLFRVDNPHTKPFPFWEWMIADIRARHPDTIFLAEAFTRPKLMYRLAKIGFSQSYTYFTWRNTKQELEEYLTELTTTAPKEFFRPHFFVNTPDINPFFLQTSGRAGFLIRAALAATLSGLWGVYNGFELCEAEAIPGREEYYASEKYEIKAWDHDRPGNIVAEISALNRIRKANAALHSHLNLEFLPCDNPNVLYFRKFAADGNTLLIAISFDPHNIQDTTIELPLQHFGLPDGGTLATEDLMREHSFTWHGKYQPVRLNPFDQPFCIWRITPVSG